MAAPIRRLLQDVVDHCRSTAATYWRATEEGGRLVAAVNVGPGPEKLEGLEVPVEGSLVGMVLCTGLPTAVGAEAPYHPAAMEVTGIHTTAMAAAPVRVAGRAVGVLSTINPLAADRFGPEDLERVQWHAFLLGCLLEHLDHGL
ncbi:MAG: GAF domain-containing protein [Holophaga sp.]|jgi:hypothetical protein